MSYLQWMLVLAAASLVLERVLPARAQPLVRPGFGLDVLYFAANGWLWPLLLGWAGIDFLSWTIGALRPQLGASAPLAAVPAGLQFAVVLLTLDLVKWGAHWSLHRFRPLWRFHRVHHGVTTMDWLGNWRFHGLEIVYYQLWTAVPIALLLLAGVGPGVLLAYYVFETAVGNFNHANLRVDLGPLHYLFSGPRFHLWHHDRFPSQGRARNFAIVLSLWDWLFGTARLEPTPPRELGVPETVE